MDQKERFRALVVEKTGDGVVTRQIRERSLADLPAGDLLVRVRFSSLNYKDALSATGHPGVTRQFPHTPGIDAAGEVVACDGGAYSPGDQVIVTGYDLGMETDGGWGEFIRIPSAWAVPLPAGLDPAESMALGTAGFTAALSVDRLRQAGVTPDGGDVLVTGATGGVGCCAVAILARAGYRVVAATGKVDETPLLEQLGAAAVIHRDEILAGADRPMMKERWSGAVDMVGGATLAAVVKSIRYGGAVTCCGLVGSADLAMNVYPFILRGVSLHGIDSVNAPPLLRQRIWHLLADAWKPHGLEAMTEDVPLEGLEDRIGAILAGGIRGRVRVTLG
jgi:putative YhdH/YhfP family quinone oxidoreductase